jgi:hypothetical protein
VFVDDTHAYYFIAETGPAKLPVALHGSGGHESDLLPLGEKLAPRSPVFGGWAPWDGGFAFSIVHQIARLMRPTHWDVHSSPTSLAIMVGNGVVRSPITISLSDGAIIAPGTRTYRRNQPHARFA